jgi:hypothetical protein
MKKLLTLTVFAAFFVYKTSAQTTIAVKNAAKHIGKTVTICDKVFSSAMLKPSNITQLDIGGYNPNQPLTIMIPAADRAKFKGKPEIDYRGKDVIVTGKLISYNGKPGIVITSPKQLRIVLIDNDFKPVIAKKPMK